MLFSSKVSTGVCWVAFQDNFSRLLILFIAILEKGKTEHFNYKTINSMNKNCFFLRFFSKILYNFGEIMIFGWSPCQQQTTILRMRRSVKLGKNTRSDFMVAILNQTNLHFYGKS
jgi:hypothetical protein